MVCVSVIQAKVEVLRTGLRLVVDLGIKDVKVEVDSQRLVNSLKDRVAPMSHLESLYDIIHNLFLFANVVPLTFQSRKQNGVAYRSA